MKTSFNQKAEIYDKCLRKIKDINFTPREIDIISCIIHNRGEKKIASLLSISPKTVSVHTYNTASRIGRSSRDAIIDFVEKSGKLQYFRQYYIYLLLESSLEQCLKKISNLRKIDCVTYLITQPEEVEQELIKTITKHLKHAKINLIVNKENTIEKLKEDNIQFLYYGLLNINVIGGYYLKLVEFLRSLTDSKEVSKIIQEFQEEFNAFKKSIQEIDSIAISLKPDENHQKTIIAFLREFKVATIVLIITITCMVCYYFSIIESKKYTKAIAELDEFLSHVNTDITDSSMEAEQMRKNYDLAKKAEKIMMSLNDIHKKLYFQDASLLSIKLLAYLDNLNSIASYYTYHEHNGQKSRELLLHAKSIVNDYINSKSVTKVNLDKLSDEEVYTELKIIQDLPETYTRVIYFLGRSYIYQGDRREAKKYFERAEYLGNKLGIFEGYLSRRSGIGILNKEEIIEKARKERGKNIENEILRYIKFYSELRHDNKKYKISYRPGIKEQKTIIPKNDTNNVIECLGRILYAYTKLISVTDSTTRKEKYTQEILQYLIREETESKIFERLPEITDRKQSSLYNNLADVLLVLYDEKTYFDEFGLRLSEILNITYQDKLSFIQNLLKFACLKSRSADFTKADSYDRIIKVYRRKIADYNLKDTEKRMLKQEISELKEKAYKINKFLQRTPQED